METETYRVAVTPSLARRGCVSLTAFTDIPVEPYHFSWPGPGLQPKGHNPVRIAVDHGARVIYAERELTKLEVGSALRIDAARRARAAARVSS